MRRREEHSNFSILTNEDHMIIQNVYAYKLNPDSLNIKPNEVPYYGEVEHSLRQIKRVLD